MPRKAADELPVLLDERAHARVRRRERVEVGRRIATASSPNSTNVESPRGRARRHAWRRSCASGGGASIPPRRNRRGSPAPGSRGSERRSRDAGRREALLFVGAGLARRPLDRVDARGHRRCSMVSFLASRTARFVRQSRRQRPRRRGALRPWRFMREILSPMHSAYIARFDFDLRAVRAHWWAPPRGQRAHGRQRCSTSCDPLGDRSCRSFVPSRRSGRLPCSSLGRRRRSSPAIKIIKPMTAVRGHRPIWV